MIIAFTGAGISKASGIKTFEEQGDMRLKLSRSHFESHRKEVLGIISKMESQCRQAEPNDAHKALAEYNIPIITMNIDELHQRAGSVNVLPIHGKFPNIVLYEDPAPLYNEARSWVDQLTHGDKFIVIGVSDFTTIAIELPIIAMGHGADVVKISTNAETEVRKVLEDNKGFIESFEEFIKREF